MKAERPRMALSIELVFLASEVGAVDCLAHQRRLFERSAGRTALHVMVVCVGGTTLRLMSKVPVPSLDSCANPSDESEGEQGIAHPVPY
ncbi:hypothetical protein B0H13DRAFT_2318962 [Mycena leptocephala]|nr:hypothetical protein B0H13DRAFT_2318962 [Mycena leptocephala]